MKDNIAKAKGLPFSTSRSQEKANKRNTQKARRQDGKRQVQMHNDLLFPRRTIVVCQNTLAKYL